MLEIQKFLRSHNPKSAVRHAVEKWALEVYEEGDLVQLNYSMIDSPRGVVEPDECRGLILCRPSWKIVAYPFYRFYNQSESHAANVKSRNGTLVEKLDGSLTTLYHYGGKWNVATRGRIFADGNVGRRDNPLTFHDLFWQTVVQRFDPQYHDPATAEFPENLCMVFELTSPENRVVTPYFNRNLSLLMARDKDADWNELLPDQLDELAELIGANRPRVYPFKNKNHIMNLLPQIGQLEEGFVFVDYTQLVNGSFKRVKIKNPTYLAAARFIESGFDETKALELILTGETSEFLAYFPEYRDLVMDVTEMFVGLGIELDAVFKEIEGLLPDRRAFALEAQKSRRPAVLFAMADGKYENGKDGVLRSVSDSKGNLIRKRVKNLWDTLKDM